MRTAAHDSDSDDEETRRIEYLHRHRAMLEQKRRLETERRVNELETDKTNITKRQHDLHAANEKAVKDVTEAKRKLGAAASLPSLRHAIKPSADETSLRVYAEPDDLSLEILRVIAEKQALRDMTPLNTRGKYHARYMKDAYPIAGSQLRLEKERELILTAKKRIVLAKADTPTIQSTRPMERSHTFGRLTYRKLDMYVDKFSNVLQREQRDVDIADEQRHVRLLDVQHQEGLEQFWTLMRNKRHHEALSWLKTHHFRDVNLPIVLRQESVLVDKIVGITPLMAACRLRHVALVRALLDQDAVVYLTTANGDTAMHYLFENWQDQQLTTLRRTTETFVRAEHTLRILHMLLEQQGVNVNAQNAFGETVLQRCACLGLFQCVELLLSHGGDVALQDRSGTSALVYARANGHDAIVRLMETYAIVEHTKAKERTRKETEAKLRQKRGILTADWSESPEKLLARLAVEDRRAGHLRNQFVDRHGNVIVCDDDTDEV